MTYSTFPPYLPEYLLYLKNVWILMFCIYYDSCKPFSRLRFCSSLLLFLYLWSIILSATCEFASFIPFLRR